MTSFHSITKKKKTNKHVNLNIPLQQNIKMYSMNDLNNEQRYIAYSVVHRILLWIKIGQNNRHNHTCSFQSLFITVTGAAGSGKGFLIHTLVTAVRMITGVNNSVIITAPTGSSAGNIDGQTIHTEFGLNPFNLSSALSMTKRKQLLLNMRRHILLIIDERSMLPSELLAVPNTIFQTQYMVVLTVMLTLVVFLLFYCLVMMLNYLLFLTEMVEEKDHFMSSIMNLVLLNLLNL